VNAVFEVGGVLGGVIGSKAEPAGEGESVLSSVRPSGASVDVAPEEEDTWAEKREEPRPRPAVR
jgi:hypothetical protein